MKRSEHLSEITNLRYYNSVTIGSLWNELQVLKYNSHNMHIHNETQLKITWNNKNCESTHNRIHLSYTIKLSKLNYVPRKGSD